MKVASPPPTVMQQNKKGIMCPPPSHTEMLSIVSVERAARATEPNCPWICADVAASLPASLCHPPGHGDIPDIEGWGTSSPGLWHGEMRTAHQQRSLGCAEDLVPGG